MSEQEYKLEEIFHLEKLTEFQWKINMICHFCNNDNEKNRFGLSALRDCMTVWVNRDKLIGVFLCEPCFNKAKKDHPAEGSQ